MTSTAALPVPRKSFSTAGRSRAGRTAAPSMRTVATGMAGVSGWQLVRLTPDGRVDQIIEMPVERPSKPMFGGPGLDVLYVTSIGTGLTPGREADQPEAGSLFAVTGLGVTGVEQWRFAG